MVSDVECFARISNNYSCDFIIFIVYCNFVDNLIEGCDCAMAFSAAMVVFVYNVI